jgi:hypothetical protein
MFYRLNFPTFIRAAEDAPGRPVVERPIPVAGG